LLMRISNGNGKVPQLISLAPELIVRESTGPARVL
jgi:DNA-binding LacI/PurR family transcriptional regulator